MGSGASEAASKELNNNNLPFETDESVPSRWARGAGGGWMGEE